MSFPWHEQATRQPRITHFGDELVQAIHGSLNLAAAPRCIQDMRLQQPILQHVVHLHKGLCVFACALQESVQLINTLGTRTIVAPQMQLWPINTADNLCQMLQKLSIWARWAPGSSVGTILSTDASQVFSSSFS
jgi:hypothetical protein